MYQAVEGVLAWTGFGSGWMVLAGFALIATGAAIMRIVPKRRKNES
jgi:hypothetical protein